MNFCEDGIIPAPGTCETDLLMSWCGSSNLELSALKTGEMILDSGRTQKPPPVIFCDTPVTSVLMLPGLHHHPEVGAEHQLPHQEVPQRIYVLLHHFLQFLVPL
ncbi:hypothetical protein ILYODFUR_029633 [Ilyodon furcidens]|uniref:Uncharacterized protein n=1 Tax=Ilyodon furcidens TaxID=33524 RepID=A0ABV0TMS0_9TELE